MGLFDHDITPKHLGHILDQYAASADLARQYQLRALEMEGRAAALMRTLPRHTIVSRIEDGYFLDDRGRLCRQPHLFASDVPVEAPPLPADDGALHTLTIGPDDDPATLPMPPLAAVEVSAGLDDSDVLAN